ncbi:MAG: hypothetical protein KDD70_15050, partial [Bdellovibrionales bacterium]|nr:hypothetical protein [Bdellovibrionales bacterium]
MTNRSKWCPLLFFVSNLLLVSTVFAAPALSPSLQRDLSVLLRAPKAKQEIVIIAKGADAELIENKDAIAQFKRSKRDLPYSHGAVVEVSSADLERLLSFREETHEILLNEKIFKGAEAENNQIIGTLAANQLGFGGAG